MFQEEKRIRKEIVTPDGEDEFQIRYIRNEDAGIVVTRSGKSYFILDSIEYWYDLIQNKYPTKQKCRCKNDYFRLCFQYVPRIGTDDYKAVELISCCTECRKQRKFAEIDIDYSPTAQLFRQPITYCKQPKMKYKLQSICGEWGEEAFYDLIFFLLQKQLLVYCFYTTPENKLDIKRFDAEELKQHLAAGHMDYWEIYFSMEPLDDLFGELHRNPWYVWRKREVIQINYPIKVLIKNGEKYGKYSYSIDCCSEYIDAGQVKRKSESFCRLVQEFLEYSKERLK